MFVLCIAQYYVLFFRDRVPIYSEMSRLVSRTEKIQKNSTLKYAKDKVWIEKNLKEGNWHQVRNISKVSRPPIENDELLSPLSPKRPVEEPSAEEMGRGRRRKFLNPKYSDSSISQTIHFATSSHQDVSTALDLDALGLDDDEDDENDENYSDAPDTDDEADAPKPKPQSTKCKIKYSHTIEAAGRIGLADYPLAMIVNAVNKDKGEKNPSCYVTGYDMEKQRNDEGEAEIASHFDKKCGFDNMEFDSKSSKTLQKDGTLKVVSNCTCVTDGTFTEFFQPEDGCGITYAKELHKVVNKYHAEETFTYIGADSTVSNTGPKGGKCFPLEKIFTI